MTDKTNIDDTLYATDLDGTLLGADARLSDTTARAIKRLQQMGARMTFITARTPATIEPILSPAPSLLPGVAMTGAAVWDSTSRRYLEVAYHRPDDVTTIAEICRRRGVTPFVYTMPRETNSLVVYHSAPVLTAVEQRFVDDRTLNDLKRFNLATEAPAATTADTVLFFAMGNPDDIEAVAADIRAATDCYASCYPDTYNPGLSLLEVFRQGVSKAGGIDLLRRHTGARRIVAFGDNLNDIPMLQRADVAVAVDNAHPDVKAIADVVIGENTSNSVVRYIESDYLERHR